MKLLTEQTSVTFGTVFSMLFYPVQKNKIKRNRNESKSCLNYIWAIRRSFILAELKT